MILYIDIIFLENLIMNLAIIFSEAICLNSTDKKFRKVLAGIICTLFYIIQLFNPQFVYFQWIISICTVFIAFGKSNFRNIVKQVILFYFISFLFGGVSFALMSIINKGRVSIINGIIIGKFGLKLIVLSGILSFLMIVLVLKKRKSQLIKNLIISFNEKKINIKVLLDTGNLLREPYKNRPVVIVEKNSIKNLLPEMLFKEKTNDEKEYVKNGKKQYENDYGKKEKNDCQNSCKKESGNEIDSIDLILSGKKEVPRGMFLIPYRSIGNRGGMLLGIVPKYVIVKESGRKYENIVIGVCSECLSESGKYNGIFGLDSLDGGSV